MIKLIGILIIIIGFILKLDAVSVIVVSVLTTAFAGGLSFYDAVSTLGSAFVDTRYVSLSVLTLPAIALMGRHGLRETASRLIRKSAKATAGTILSVFEVLCTTASTFSIRVGHVQFVRPVLYPIVKAAAEKQFSLSTTTLDKIKALSCAMENYSNFFGQNIFVAAPGVFLVVGTLQELGITVDPYGIAVASIPMGISAASLACIQNYLFDRELKKQMVTL